MNIINWNIFNVKNPRYEDAFEEMCLHIFCREFKIDAHNFKANFNQTGLEIEPYYFDGRYYGFQSKYITGTGSNLYSQVYTSLSKTLDIYKDKIDIIFIYTNLNIKPNVTKEEIYKYEENIKKMGCKKKSYLKEIKLLEKNFKVEIKFITESNFKLLLKKQENNDLYRMFFSPENEKGFLKNILSIEDRTFLRSNQFVDLPINGNCFNVLKVDILNENSLIIGHAGTGKTEIMKNLFLHCEENFLNLNNKNSPIPVFVRLRECVNGNLEDLIRQRFRDHHLEMGSKRKCIYFLDGVDEMYASFTSLFISQVKRLEQQPETERIILSSRPNSVNLSNLCSVFNLNKYQIAPLDKTHIQRYFELRNCDYTPIKSFPVNDTIDDILSVALLYQNFNLLDEHTTKIDLIKYNIIAMLSNNNELQTLNIPMPYVEAITNVLKRVSIIMHRANIITIELSRMQCIIHDLYPRLTYTDIDAIISYISGLFFDYSTDINKSVIYSFRHKRYLEYFLYLYVSERFYENPFIIREENLLINKDFLLNIFLTQELKIHTMNQDINKVLVLRFLEDYLGNNYISNHKNKWIGQGTRNLEGAPDCVTSPEYLTYLCQKNEYELETYLKINSDKLSTFLTTENYWTFIRMYYMRNNIDIREMVLQICGYKGDDVEETPENAGDILYYKIIVKKEFSVDKFYTEYIKNMDVTDLEKKLERNDKLLKNELNATVSFFDITLKNHVSWLISNMDKFSLEELEVVCYCILQKRNLKAFLNSKEFVETVLARVESNPNDKFYLYTKILYETKKRSAKYLLDIQQRLNTVNKDHYDTWRTGLDGNNFCAIISGESCHLVSMTYSLGVALAKIIVENSQSKREILTDIIDEVRKYNFIGTSFFAYENAVCIGNIICSYTFDFNDIKKFLKELGDYENVVSTFNVLYTIFTCDIELFKIVANKKCLKKAYYYNIKQLTYYDWLSDTNFRYATMLSVFDKIEAENICLQGIGNSLLRPIFRKESILKSTLPQCIEVAAVNQWFTSDELEHMCYRVLRMLEIAKETLDSGSRLDALREVVKKYLPYSELNEKLYEYQSNSGNINGTDKIVDYVNFDESFLNEENLKNYYECKVKNVQFGSFAYWKTLIKFEYSIDPELKILYEILNRNYFPSSWSKISNYYKYIIAILIEMIETRHKSINLLMSLAHRDVIPLMINVFSLTGNEDKGKSLIEIFVSLCETLICIENPKRKNVQIGSYKYQIMREIYTSTYLDWIFDEENQIFIFVKNTEISIRWDDEENCFCEEWATSHSDSRAYKRIYSILLKGLVIDTISLVYVDGHRALIPMPRMHTNIISRNDYKFALIVNQEDSSVNEYIVRSGLIID